MLCAAVGQLVTLWAAESWAVALGSKWPPREEEAETLPAPGEQLQDRRESRAQGLDPWQPWELRHLSKLPGQHAAQLLVGLQISAPVGFYFFLHREEQHDPAVCTHHWSRVAELFRHPVFDLC